MSNINLQMAWRNIWRNKLRSSVVIVAITVGLFGGLAASGIMKGMVRDMIDNALENTVSHIQIHDQRFIENNEVIFLMKNTSELINKIKTLPETAAVCQRTKSYGMASTASKALGVMINGIVPEKEKQVTKIYTKLTDSLSKYFSSGKKNRILISQNLAKKLNAKLKSKIVLTFQDYNGNLTGASFKVEGIFKTQNAMFDEQNVFVRKKDLDRILDMPANSSHEIAVLLNDYKKTPEVTEKIKNFTEYYVEGWNKIDPYLELTTSLTGFTLLIFMTIILLALGFAIVNTMLMVILERTKELGMIMAIGMNKRKVFIMIMQETSMLTLTGGVLGIIVSILFISYFGKVGIDISSVAQGFAALGYGSVMYPYLSITDYLQVIGMVLLTGIISSIFPTIRAIKMKPAEAVRTD
jgi:ABC-type lipoprotein release transport system permease subunit